MVLPNCWQYAVIAAGIALSSGTLSGVNPLFKERRCRLLSASVRSYRGRTLAAFGSYFGSECGLSSSFFGQGLGSLFCNSFSLPKGHSLYANPLQSRDIWVVFNHVLLGELRHQFSDSKCTIVFCSAALLDRVLNAVKGLSMVRHTLNFWACKHNNFRLLLSSVPATACPTEYGKAR